MTDKEAHALAHEKLKAMQRHEDDPLMDAYSHMLDHIFGMGDPVDHDAMMRALAEDCSWRKSQFAVIYRGPAGDYDYNAHGVIALIDHIAENRRGHEINDNIDADAFIHLVMPDGTRYCPNRFDADGGELIIYAGEKLP